MKKIYKLAVGILIFLLGLTACSGSSDKEQNTSESKYDIGMELIANLSELSKDENYVHAILPATEDAVVEMVDGIRAMDYSDVEHVYRVKNIDEVITAGMYMAGFGNDTSSDIVKSVLEAKFVISISNWITAQRTSNIALAVRAALEIAVSATAGYIIVDDYIGADGDALSKDIGFSMLNIKLEEVEKK